MMQKLVVALILFLLILNCSVHAEPQAIAPLEKNLLQVLELEESIREDLEQAQKELRSPEAAGRKEELESRVRALSKRLEEIRLSFTEIALGVDLSSLQKLKRDDTFSWSEELRELLSPLMAELKDLTKRPREISRLKEELAIFKQQKLTAQNAEKNLKRLQDQLTSDKLKAPVGKLLTQWEERLNSLNAELAIAEEKLNQKMSERRSIGQTLQGFASLFFESRGRNLIIAFIAALLVLFSFRHIPKIVLGTLGDRAKKLSKAGKIVQVVGLALSGVSAALTFLGVLYLFEDWVLLLIFSLLFLGLLWTMKDTLPQLWQQLALLLNIGPVREGERVEINDIPYIVQSIGFYCYLKNNEFSTGKTLRLPIQDLLGLRSRRTSPGERLFPTKEGDYVTFHGDRYGKITFQSPDYVEITGFGGSKFLIPSNEFLAAQPRVLSDGWGQQVTFGIDYAHQATSTEEIPRKLREHIFSAFEKVSLNEQVNNLTVEFKEAGASSLDIAIIAEFTGQAAGRYLSLPRLIQRACVDACNENGWVIPFTQLTLHMADSNKEATLT